MRPVSNRPGYVLVAVLWTVTGAVALGIGLAELARGATGVATNRTNLTRAHWLAEGCAERVRAIIADAFASSNTSAILSATGGPWLTLDSLVMPLPMLAGCDITLRPSGTRMDVNRASVDALRSLLLGIGVGEGRADSLLDALLDWRDADDTPRPFGAEQAWYRAARRLAPRNGSLASSDELHLVRGFEQLGGADSVLGIDPERILLARAPAVVLGALPGMSAEAVDALTAMRTSGHGAIELAAVASVLSPPARMLFLAHYAELAEQTTAMPEAWTVTASATVGQPPVMSTVELRLANAGHRAAVVRHRVWP